MEEDEINLIAQTQGAVTFFCSDHGRAGQHAALTRRAGRIF